MTREMRDAVGGSVEKAFALVAELATAANPPRLGDLADRTGMTKPTAHRLLRSLTAMGYARSLGDGVYTTGPALLGVAAAALGGVEERPLVRRTLDELNRRTGLTASFAIRSGDSAVVIDNVEPDQAYRVSPRLGVATSLADSAAGLAMLAHEGSSVDATDTDTGDRLEQVRRTGFAYDDGDPAPAVRSLAAVVEHDGRIAGALVVTGLTFTLNTESVEVFGPIVVEQARLLSATLDAMLPRQHAQGIA